METENTNNSQNGQQKQTQGTAFSGLDLGTLLPKETLDAIKPFLTSGVLAGGIYLFLIKPLKDRMDIQEKSLDEIKKRLDAQKEYILDLETRLEHTQTEINGINDGTEKKRGLFDTKKRTTSHSSSLPTQTNEYRRRGLTL